MAITYSSIIVSTTGIEIQVVLNAQLSVNQISRANPCSHLDDSQVSTQIVILM